MNGRKYRKKLIREKAVIAVYQKSTYRYQQKKKFMNYLDECYKPSNG
ncbi:MAG: hypothetical protein ACLTAI_14705 [Thomasclavelia sp.]